MLQKQTYALIATLMCATTFTGCGPRGDDTGTDASASSAAASSVGFLLFPNPQVQSDGSYQTNTAAYAAAYYAAVDPLSTRTTLDAWKTQNQFGSGTGTEVTVVFRDVHDLGYGRRMTARQNTDGSVAVMVENYNVTAIPGQTYGPLNLEAAINRDSRWHVGTNGIEFSGPTAATRFAKFFNFSPTTGQRQLTADLDSNGQKAMPGICISCHGGRGDPLNADGSFPNGGNAHARLQPLNVGTFEFSSLPGYTRADQEANLKTINQFVLCTYPIDSAGSGVDACRPVVSTAEWTNYWQATAADMVKDWYGGATMPNATQSDTYLPAGWSGQAALYNDVVAPYCRTCHILRGAGVLQNDIDFMDYAKFQAYASRIKAHVLDRGNMPLAQLVSNRFWNSSAPDTLATFLQGVGEIARDGNGAVLRPGRPIANPGINRHVPSGSTVLSGSNSLFASSYSWSVVSGAAALTNANTATPTFTAGPNGNYVVQLVVSNGTTSSDPVQMTLTVDNTFPYAPNAIRFSDIRTAFQTTLPCLACHDDSFSSGAPSWEANAGSPPIFYSDYNRGGTSGTAGDGTFTAASTDDDYWFYVMLRGRINLTDPAASPILRKPTGNHHGGGMQLSVTSHNYSMFANWILNGAPYN
jgi:hypothetical protein